MVSALPVVLEELADAGLSATFFVEGVNAEIYPEALRSIAGAGHEVGFHAWCHEDWGALAADAEAEADNLDRGLAALRGIGLEVAGFRPPGGLIGPDTVELLRERGLRHCSPAGSAPGLDGGVAVLPFAWPAVDVFHVLPQFAALRKHVTGSEEAGGPDAVREALLAAVDQAVADGGHAVLVLHTWMTEAVRDALHDVLARSAAGAGVRRAVGRTLRRGRRLGRSAPPRLRDGAAAGPHVRGPTRVGPSPSRQPIRSASSTMIPSGPRT